MIVFLTMATLVVAHSGPSHGASSSGESSESSNAETSKERQYPGHGKPPHAPLSAYKPDELRGWKLKVHEDLIADKALHQKVMDELQHQLYLITVSVPKDKVALLKKVPIWVELDNPYHPVAQYHPSADWLSKNGYLPEKAQCVEISNAKNFIRQYPHHKQNTMLHEFAHAYHHLHLDFEHPRVIAAYDKVVKAGTYDEVQHVNGRTSRHYALTDHKEYFAECTEAFFGANEYWPFVRPELKNADQDGYSMVQELWGASKK